MTLDDFDRVARAAALSIETLLESWLPNGVREGHECLVGSRSGEAGRSMRIRITGDKAGFWSDFAADGEAGRDLISLYAYLHDLKQGAACREVAQQLGIDLGDGPAEQPVSRRPAINPAAAPAKDAGEKKARTPWVPLLPVPDDAGPYPAAHSRRGRPERHWEYRDQQGRLLGVIYRFKTSDGGKEVLPCVYARHPDTDARDWRWMALPEPRPLYLRGPLRPELAVLVVEGEKCADAAHAMLGDAWDVVSWPGGGKALGKADWSPLAGRRVVLWADADAKVYGEKHVEAGEIMPEQGQPGMRTMLKLESILLELGCTVRLVDIPAPDAPHGAFEPGAAGHDGWDIADLIDGGASRADVDGWLQRLREVDEPAPLAPADDPVPAEDGPPAWVTDPAVHSDARPGNVVPLRPGVFTPSRASASSMTRRQVKPMMIPGSSPGSVKGCRENVYMALINDPVLAGLVALDLFALQQVKTRMPPWHSEPGEWTEGDDFHLGIYLAQHYSLVIASVGDIEKAVAQAARENGFNPVIDMLDAAAAGWDGVDRVESAFATYWGAPASDYMQLVSRMFFVGLVKRAYCPGVKHDDAPVFEGAQGEGKSTALAILGGQWFADTPFRMGDKDGYLSIQSVWLYEIAELEQFNRSEVTAVKAFMSSQQDRYREPYGRRTKNQPRRTVFAATTNEGQYFKDPTGNRRFWPVETRKIDLEALRHDRDQLLGEAVHMMRAGVLWYPTPEQQRELISPQQADRQIWDEWTGIVYDYLEGLSPDGSQGLPKQSVTGRELLTKALHFDISKLSAVKSETMRIASIMRTLGWLKKRYETGLRERYYARPPKGEPDQDAAAREPDVGSGMADDDALPI